MPRETRLKPEHDGAVARGCLVQSTLQCWNVLTGIVLDHLEAPGDEDFAREAAEAVVVVIRHHEHCQWHRCEDAVDSRHAACKHGRRGSPFGLGQGHFQLRPSRVARPRVHVAGTVRQVRLALKRRRHVKRRQHRTRHLISGTPLHMNQTFITAQLARQARRAMQHCAPHAQRTSTQQQQQPSTRWVDSHRGTSTAAMWGGVRCWACWQNEHTHAH